MEIAPQGVRVLVYDPQHDIGLVTAIAHGPAPGWRTVPGGFAVHPVRWWSLPPLTAPEPGAADVMEGRS